MAQAGTLTLAALVVHLRARLLDALRQPPGDSVQAELTDLWRMCLTIHDLAESRHDRAYVALMERMIDAVADYNTYRQPEKTDWAERLPSVEEIESVA